MRKIREVLRLHYAAGLGRRAISRSLRLSPATVGEYLRRAQAAGLGWPLPEALDESMLQRRIFPPPPAVPLQERPIPVWEEVHRELKATKGMSLFLLWQEYKARSPEGFQYSWFCEQYRAWAGKLDLVMRQEHRAGEKLFVDYAGQTVPVIDRVSGEMRPAHIFVAVLGASNYTYAEATWTQGLADWIGAHVRAFAYLDGVPEILVPDNLKSGVHKACRYEPDLNPTYQELAAHYGVAVIPARVRKPRDKAKAEVGVQIVERWILARLRHAQFFSLPELNQAIRGLLEALNARPFKKLPGSRRTLFEHLDRPALRPLPTEPYVYAEWKRARVHIDYHVEVEGHYYSVPYPLVKQVLDVRLSAHTIECFHKGQRVASHLRSPHKGRHTTASEHMPQAHRHYAEWTPQRLIDWAAKTGPATAAMVETILARRAHPQQGFRSCLGLLRLGKDCGEQRLEAACRRALAVGGTSFKSVQAILKHGLDRQPLPSGEPARPAPAHGNLRGPKYYH
jgi:transposase